MKFLQWLKMVLRRFRAQGVHYIGGSDVLPPPLSPEEEAAAFADAIVSAKRDWNDKPRDPQRMKRVTVETFGVDYPEPEKC